MDVGNPVPKHDHWYLQQNCDCESNLNRQSTGLRKEKKQLAASKMAEDRRHTKAFKRRLDVLRGKVVPGGEGPQETIRL